MSGMASLAVLSAWSHWGLVAVGGVVLLLAGTVVREEWRVRGLRKKHVAGRQPVSDEEFLAEVGGHPGQRHVIFAVRTAVATAMGVPAETLRAADTLDYIMAFSFDYMDLMEIIVCMKKVLKVTIPHRFLDSLFEGGRTPEQTSLGDLSRYVAENWDSLRPVRTQ